MATLHRNKKILEKLELPIAILLTVGYVFLSVYVYFIRCDFELFAAFETWILLCYWIVYGVLFIFTFSATTIEEYVKHIFCFFIPSALCCGIVYYWINNIFTPNKSSDFWILMNVYYPEYKKFVFETIVKTSMGMVIFGSFICIPKYKKTNNNWLKSRIK